MRNFIRTANSFLASRKFFIFVVALLVLQAAWLALTARYPLAFDENFHFGIIKLYAEQWSPIFSQTPPDSGAYGALVREPSYLFHYLMSFPYRLISLFVSNETFQIITLRFLNIAMFAAGLVAFRHLLRQVGIGPRLINFSLLMLVTIPVVPYLAAHINYDNLLFLLVPVTLSFATSVARSVRQSGTIPAATFLSLAILVLLTTLVKFVFLPIALAIGMYLLVVFWRQKNIKMLLAGFFQDFKRLRLPVQSALIIGLIVSGGLFIERDVMNVVRYGAPSPKCAKVESIEHCSKYGPWARDYGYSQKIESGEWTKPKPDALGYSVDWFRGLLHRLYFAINHNYFNKPPLPVLYYGSMGIGLVGSLLFLYYGRRIITRNRQLILPLAAVLLYALALFHTNYSAYLSYGVRVAINGRYFIPLLPIIFVLIGLAYRHFFSSIPQPWRRYAKVLVALFILFMLTQGGGVLTFIVHSGPDWYWQNQLIVDTYKAAQRVITPFIIGA